MPTIIPARPRLSAMADADITAPVDGQQVQWNATAQRWENVTPVHAGGLVIGSSAGADLARTGAPTFFTSDSFHAGDPIADGDDTTFWVGFIGTAGDPSWVGIDFGVPRSVGSARVLQRPGDTTPPYHVKVQAQAPGDSSWVTLAENVDPPNDWKPAFSAVTYQRWRVFFPREDVQLTFAAVVNTFELHASAGTPVELPAGSNGQVLTMVNGAPAWV